MRLSRTYAALLAACFVVSLSGCTISIPLQNSAATGSEVTVTLTLENPAPAAANASSAAPEINTPITSPSQTPASTPIPQTTTSTVATISIPQAPVSTPTPAPVSPSAATSVPTPVPAPAPTTIPAPNRMPIVDHSFPAQNDYSTSDPITQENAASPVSTPSTSTNASSETGAATNTDTSVTISGNAAQVIALVNQQRQAAGVPALSYNAAGQADADRRAMEIVSDFSHNGFESTSANGENIAMGYPSPADVVANWMNSDGHRKNILNNSFTSIAVGCYESGGYLYWVQLFYR